MTERNDGIGEVEPTPLRAYSVAFGGSSINWVVWPTGRVTSATVHRFGTEWKQTESGYESEAVALAFALASSELADRLATAMRETVLRGGGAGALAEANAVFAGLRAR